MMKKILLIASAVCLVFLLCACQVPSESGDENATTNARTEMTEPPQCTEDHSAATEPISVSVPDETTNPEMSEWKTAYLDYLETQKDFHLSYALVYIDDDDIPELFLSGDCEATGDGVCSFKNGKVLEQRLRRTGGGRYVERTGAFCNRNGHMGQDYTDVYILTEDGFVRTFSAQSSERLEDIGKEEYILCCQYMIGDENVNADVYITALKAAFDFANAQTLHANEVTYDVIRQQILDF